MTLEGSSNILASCFYLGTALLVIQGEGGKTLKTFSGPPKENYFGRN
jgi:hypothetical protein